MATRVPVIASKLRPPTLPERVVFLPRYAELAEQLAGRRLTAVVAPAGYGKTTFLVSLAGRLPEGWSLGWCALDDMDADPTIFLTYLLAAFDAAVPGSAAGALQVLHSVADAAREGNLVIAALCEELWKQGPARPGLIILDDHHLVNAVPAVGSALQYLVANLPPSFHVVLAGRERPRLSTSKLELNDDYLAVGPADLAFSRSDVRTYLNDVCRLGLDDQGIDAVSEATEGWPAGLVLATKVISLGGGEPRRGELRPGELRSGEPRRGEIRAALSSPRGRRNAVFDYFSSEVLSRLSPDDRRFLAAAAHLHYLTAEACAAVLGVEPVRARERLDDVVRQGLFLTATESGPAATAPGAPRGSAPTAAAAGLASTERVYRFHSLFRDALLQHHAAESDPVETRDLNLRAAGHYEEIGRYDAAMAHYLAAGDDVGAAALLRRRGDEMIARGHVDQMRYWLKALPRERLDGDPFLLFYMGYVHQHSDPQLAVDHLERAASGLAARGELRFQVRALIYMATIYSLQNRVDKVRETAARIPALRALSRDSWARGVLVVSALTQAAWDDNLRRGVWLARLARHLPLDEEWRWAMLAYSCMVQYRLGDLRLAGRLIAEAMELDVVRSNDVWRGMALTLLHVVLYSEDDDAAAEKVRAELWDLGERYDSDYYRAYANRAMAHARWHHGSREEARELFVASQYHFERTGNRAMAAITQLDRALMESEVGNARAVLPEAEQALADLGRLDSGQGLLELGQTVFGAVAREAGDLAAAERALVAAARASRGKGSKQILAGTSLHLAQLYADKGDAARADEHLRAALELSAAHGYVLYWDMHFPTVLRMAVRAIARNIHPAQAERLLAHWFGKEAAPALRNAAGQAGRGGQASPAGQAGLAGSARQVGQASPGGRRAELEAAAERLAAIPAGGLGHGPSGDGTGWQGTGWRGMGWQETGWRPDASAAEPRLNLDVHVLGDFAVQVNGEPVPPRNWQTRQVRKLFKYLLLERGRKLSREQLMEFLWPEADPRAAAASLRVTLSRLRQALTPAGDGPVGEEPAREEPAGPAPAPSGQPLLRAEQGLVWLHEGLTLSVDASIFNDLIEQGRAAGEKGDWAAARQALEEAVALYRGDLLPEDLYEDWTAAERERLQLLYLEALVSLAQVYRRTSPPETAMPRAIEVLRRALGVNPYREDIVRELMSALIAVGQKDEAVRAFLRYRDTVREEFATAPGTDLVNLARSAGHRG